MCSLRSCIPVVDLEFFQGTSSKKIMNNKKKPFLDSKHDPIPPVVSTPSELIEMIEAQIIGGKRVFQSPFGPRRLVYMDHTASGKSLKCIEAFIEKEILPLYANTHTDASFTARQTTAYRTEARQIVHNCVDGDEDDVVVFHGSGTTACVHKLVHSVCGSGGVSLTAGLGPIVFVGPHEHHSNLLPWREARAEVINIPRDKYGHMDIKVLENRLSAITKQKVNQGRLLLGCFSAGSNVTGALNDDIALTILMHQYGGFAFFDYAAAGPHVKISMNPRIKDKKMRNLARKDAIYFSGHKFVGGPQTTGVLVAKRHIFRNSVPHGAGGGSVFFVTPNKHAYLADIAEREEGGTPAIVSSIRLGLVLKLKTAIGEQEIIARESFFTRRALKRWTNVPGLFVLGNMTAPRLPIISFLIEHISTGYYLHYNFVVSLLNDLFGIQSRGGCMCAGPYAQTLLGIDQALVQKYITILFQPRFQVATKKNFNQEPQFDVIFRPGFTRVSFPFHASLEEVDFVIDAVEFVAKHGWKFLPFYKMNPAHGSFTHMADPGELTSLKSTVFTAKGLEKNCMDMKKSYVESFPPNYQNCLKFANESARNITGYQFNDVDLSPGSESLRWFLLPSEAVACANRINVKPSLRPLSLPKVSNFKKFETFTKSYVESIPGQLITFGWNRSSVKIEDLNTVKQSQEASFPQQQQDTPKYYYNDDLCSTISNQNDCSRLNLGSYDSGVGRSASFPSPESSPLLGFMSADQFFIQSSSSDICNRNPRRDFSCIWSHTASTSTGSEFDANSFNRRYTGRMWY